MEMKNTHQLEEGTYDREAELKAFDETKLGVRGLVESGVTKIPRIFNSGLLDITENAPTDSLLSVPIIDLRDIHNNHAGLIDQIRSACKEWGFFQVINHEIPITLLDDMIDGIRRFHEDPEVRKQYYTRDFKRKFLYYSNTSLYRDKSANWRDTVGCLMAPNPPKPEELPQVLRGIIFEYSKKIMELGCTIIELLSEALGLNPSHLKELNCVGGLFIQGHYYPPCPEPELTMGTSKHTDIDFMTIVLQDQLGGLQVLRDNKWFNVPPVHGALVVSLVVPPENGTTVAGGQQGSQSDGHRQGTGTAGSTAQNEAGSGMATDSLSRHEARLQAAAAAASIYEKSYVYPSASSSVCSPGHAFYTPTSTGFNGEQASSEQAQKQFLIPGQPTNVSFPPMGHYNFLPSQTFASPVNYGEAFGNDPNIPSSQLEAHRKFLRWQIEVLEKQLRNLPETKADDRSVDDGTSSSDSRGKLIISSSSVSGHVHHDEEIQDGKA